MHFTKGIKRILDILLTVIGIIILLPLILFTAIILVLSSKGSIFFLQERVGHNGKPFMIWKFRSMHVTAEETGPQLSSEEDKRVTAWGKIMRRWRLDELQQVWNVLKGEMSRVGSRPESKYLSDQILKRHL